MKIENELFNRTDIQMSMKFGFLGIGMGGNSIAAACAEVSTNVHGNKYPYSSLLINTNNVDLNKISVENPGTKKLLIGNGKGSARNIEIGEQVFVDHIEVIEQNIITHFKETEFLWLCVGLGGGTGTGSVLEAVKLLFDLGFQGRFGLLLTLPRDSEGAVVIENALERLEIINDAMNQLGAVILVDNQKLYKDFESQTNDSSLITDYLKYINNYIATTLHEMNIVTASYNPFNETHFDASEFESLLKTKGLLHFAKFTQTTEDVARSNFKEQVESLRVEIQNGVLSDGYDLAESKHLAVSVLANESSSKRLFNLGFFNTMEKEINKIAPYAIEKPIAFYKYDNNKVKDVHFYAIFSGLSLPQRVGALSKEKDRQLDEIENFNQSKSVEKESNNLFGNTTRRTKKDADSTVTKGSDLDALFSKKKNSPIESDKEGNSKSRRSELLRNLK